MKKVIFGLIFVLITIQGYSQKYAYVNTEYILSNIPAYKAAQDKLNEISLEWQKELERENQIVEKLKSDFQSEKVLLTTDMIKQKEKEIAEKERGVKMLQNKFFGTDGELFEKRMELIKPIQDEVYDVIKEIAETGKYVVIFDTANGTTFLYVNPRFDKSDDVLEKLGYKN